MIKKNEKHDVLSVVNDCTICVCPHKTYAIAALKKRAKGH